LVGKIDPALKGHDIPAQGEALGKTHKPTSPERAFYISDG